MFGKIKNKKYHCRNNSKVKYQDRRMRQHRYPITHNYMTVHLSCLVQARRQKVVGLNQLCWPKPPVLVKCKCFPPARKMTIFTYNRENIVIIKNAIILSIVHNIFNLRDTEFGICIILVLSKKANVLNHYLNIRQYTRPSYDTIVNFEPKSNCQYHLSSSVHNGQNTFQQDVDIFRKHF